MKAEDRKHLKENELADRLGRFWQALASGSTTNTIIWGVILVGLALVIGWRYYSNATFQTRSAQWAALEQAYSPQELEQLIKDNPGSVAARTAKFHLNRFRLHEALAGVAAPTSGDRTKAADTLIEVRTRYEELARESKDDPELVQEALMGAAKAAEVLAAVPKAENSNETRGSLDDALKGYQDLAKRFPDSYLGKQAAKRALELSEHGTQVRGFYDGLMEAHGKSFVAPPLPPAPPPAPGGPSLPEAPMVAPPQPAVGPAPAPSAPLPPKVDPPIPPTAPPAGISPAEGPKSPKDEPKPKAP